MPTKEVTTSPYHFYNVWVPDERYPEAPQREVYRTLDVCRKLGTRVRIVFGYPDTGEAMLNTEMLKEGVVCYPYTNSNELGLRYRKNARKLNMLRIECIMLITDVATGRVLYRADNYKTPLIRVASSNVLKDECIWLWKTYKYVVLVGDSNNKYSYITRSAKVALSKARALAKYFGGGYTVDTDTGIHPWKSSSMEDAS